MEIELNKKQLISLIKGAGIKNLELLRIPFVDRHVSYSDQYGLFYWKGMETLTEEQLWEFYNNYCG